MPTFIVYARRTPEVLGRIVSVLHRRALEIEHLTAKRAKEPDVLHVVVDLAVNVDECSRIQAHFYKIVDVFLVEVTIDKN